MALPIQFNNTTYAPGFFGTDDGRPSATFGIDDVSTYSVSVTGRVTQPGDNVTLTYGPNAPTGYANTSATLTATQYDNSSMIEFTSTAIPPGNTTAGTYRYVLSNTQMYGSSPPAGATRTRFTADDTAVGSYNVPSATPTTPTNPTNPVNNAPCYCTGTRILSDRGEVAVEALQIGDRVVTVSGAVRPIRWIGTRSFIGRFANTNPAVLPVCVKAGAIADGVPSRDLWVSPDHALYLDDVLIPAEALVNGATIVKAERVESVTYWHVELDSHDVLLAEEQRRRASSTITAAPSSTTPPAIAACTRTSRHGLSPPSTARRASGKATPWRQCVAASQSALAFRSGPRESSANSGAISISATAHASRDGPRTSPTRTLRSASTSSWTAPSWRWPTPKTTGPICRPPASARAATLSTSPCRPPLTSRSLRLSRCVARPTAPSSTPGGSGRPRVPPESRAGRH
ncbi:Hint domain-containing protein [Methylobacterium sp. NMS12]|uniref:Hint domain-containing protein n=1 Tax=Methylobacterium sp. NMS12 TaxID=3079766 RepID=UPI003F88491C